MCFGNVLLKGAHASELYTYFDTESDSCCVWILLNRYVYFFFVVRKTFGLAFGITRMETAFYLTRRKVLGPEDLGQGMVSYWVYLHSRASNGTNSIWCHCSSEFVRLDFRRSLVSGLPSPFPEQRLVIEPKNLYDLQKMLKMSSTLEKKKKRKQLFHLKN